MAHYIQPAADSLYIHNDLSMRSDSSSLWNVTPLSYRDVFDLSMESNQDACTVDTVALDAILRDINAEEEDQTALSVSDLDSVRLLN